MKIKKPCVYVLDSGNDRIQIFTSTGTFITKWGSLGRADGQFHAPIGVGVVFLGVDIFSERVFVADTGNKRIQVFQWKPETQG
jgi:DNA-binding beta-propeller fold protein YncE